MSISAKPLTENSKYVLYSLVKFPDKSDKEIAQILEMRESTFTSIRKRLQELQYYKTLYIPMFNQLGAELLSIIFTTFNPIVPLDERVEKSRQHIEKSEELFLSMGELEKGFSVSISRDYTTLAEINETRTKLFGEMGLLDNDIPHEAIFPFRISHIHRFFDFTHLLEQQFKIPIQLIELPPSYAIHPPFFTKDEPYDLSLKEAKVLVTLVHKPEATMEEISQIEDIGLSRHTIARMKNNFIAKGLLRKVNIPDLEKIGFSMLVLYHYDFNPNSPITDHIVQQLDSDAIFFFTWRKFTAVMMGAYLDYAEYKEEKEAKLRILKESNVVSIPSNPLKYVFKRLRVLKYFAFAPLTYKILNAGLDFGSFPKPKEDVVAKKPIIETNSDTDYEEDEDN